MFKKRILTGLSLFLVFFFTDKLFCLDIDYSVNNPKFEICFDNSIVFKTQYKDIHDNQKLSFAVDAAALKSEVNVANTYNQINFTLNTAYAPKMNNFNLGVNTYIHSQTKYDVYTLFDFLIGAYFSKQFTDLFYMDASVMFMDNLSQINANKNHMKWLNTKDIALKLLFDFTVTDKLNCGLKLSSFNDYKYNLLFTPFVNFYCDYSITNSLAVGSALEFYYIDMFTLSANLNSVNFSTFVKWSF